MTIYKVEISGEFEGLACVGGADLMVNGVPIRLPDSLLTEVVPAEPSALGWYLARIGENDVVFEHQFGGWVSQAIFEHLLSWKQLHEDYPGITLQRLVLDGGVEVVEPVTLPWAYEDEDGDGRTVYVNDVPSGRLGQRVAATGSTTHMPPAKAREMARALIAAADAVERAS